MAAQPSGVSTTPKSLTDLTGLTELTFFQTIISNTAISFF